MSKKVTAIDAAKTAKRRLELVDELGALDAAIAPYERRAEEIRVELRGAAEQFQADQKVIFEGLQYYADLSKKKSERHIKSMPRVIAAIGEKRFRAVCTIALRVLDKELAPDVVAKLVTKDFRGSRTVTTAVRANVVALAKPVKTTA